MSELGPNPLAAGENNIAVDEARRAIARVLRPVTGDTTLPLREAVGGLGLPALCRHTPALAEQVLRTALWHLDRIAGHQPRLTRAQAIQRAAQDFRDEWQPQTQGLDEDLALLRGLGDLAQLQWDALRGQLRSREWQAARRASEWLQQLPALAGLLRRLGRRERADTVPPAAAPPAADRPHARHALRAVTTRCPTRRAKSPASASRAASKACCPAKRPCCAIRC